MKCSVQTLFGQAGIRAFQSARIKMQRTNIRYQSKLIFLGILTPFIFLASNSSHSSAQVRTVSCVSSQSQTYADTYRDVSLKTLGIKIKLHSSERAVLLKDGSVNVMSDSTFRYLQCRIDASKNGLKVIGGISPTIDNIKLIQTSKQSALKKIISEVPNASSITVEYFNWHGKSAVIVGSENSRFGKTSPGIIVPMNEKLLVITPSYKRSLEGEESVYEFLSNIKPLHR